MENKIKKKRDLEEIFVSERIKYDEKGVPYIITDLENPPSKEDVERYQAELKEMKEGFSPWMEGVRIFLGLVYAIIAPFTAVLIGKVAGFSIVDTYGLDNEVQAVALSLILAIVFGGVSLIPLWLGAMILKTRGEVAYYRWEDSARNLSDEEYSHVRFLIKNIPFVKEYSEKVGRPLYKSEVIEIKNKLGCD